MGALGRTARRLKAGLAALLLLTLAAALAPQDARAQSAVLTATAGNGQVTLNWTYSGSSPITKWVYFQDDNVDTARRVSAPGELFVLWDSAGLVVKRVAALTAEGRLRLVSAHPGYPPYERPADEVHIVGKVLWKVTRA